MFPAELDPASPEIGGFIGEKRSPKLLTKHQEGFPPRQGSDDLSSRFDVGAFAVETAMKSPSEDDLVAVSTT